MLYTTVTMASSISRTGKPLDRPSESDLYDRNCCPPVRAFKGLPWTFSDEAGHMYWDVADHAVLGDWVERSGMQRLLEADIDNERDVVFFVRQSAASRKAHTTFVLAEAGATLELKSRQFKNVEDEDDEDDYDYDVGEESGAEPTIVSLSGKVVSVGQNADDSYTSRAVRWMLVRDCEPTYSADE